MIVEYTFKIDRHTIKLNMDYVHLIYKYYKILVCCGYITLFPQMNRHVLIATLFDCLVTTLNCVFIVHAAHIKVIIFPLFIFIISQVIYANIYIRSLSMHFHYTSIYIYEKCVSQFNERKL